MPKHLDREAPNARSPTGCVAFNKRPQTVRREPGREERRLPRSLPIRRLVCAVLLHFFYTARRYEPVSGGTDRDVRCENALPSGTAWDAVG